MKYVRSIILFFAMCLPFTATTQILTLSSVVGPQPFLPKSSIIPVHKSSITCTQIMFDHPNTPNAVAYELKIYEVTGKDSVLFRTAKDSSCATMLGGFEFGKSHRWNY